MKKVTSILLLLLSVQAWAANNVLNYYNYSSGTAYVRQVYTYFRYISSGAGFFNHGTGDFGTVPTLAPGATATRTASGSWAGYYTYIVVVYDVNGVSYSQASQIVSGDNNTFDMYLYGGRTIVNDLTDGAPSLAKPADNPDCGMPVWSVSEPYISLWLHDEPLGYQPALGSRISFELACKQRESAAGFDTNTFSVGKRWNCSWSSYISQDAQFNSVIHFPGGGQCTYTTTNDYLTATTLAGNTTNGFTLSYPDGSKDVYGLIITNGGGVFLKAYLTQHWNAQSQKTTFNYYGYANSAPVIRLKNIVDGDGLTNTVYYATNNAYSTNLISQVIDPFGRTASLGYNTNGDLTNITDVAGNSTAISYDTNDWVLNMATPYGTTSFTITDSGTNAPPNGRSILATRPDGSRELYLSQDQAPGIDNDYPGSAIPDTTPFANTLDNTNLDVRDTFYWGARQYAALSTTNPASFSASDFLKARMQHWLLSDSNQVGQTISLQRDPSQDSAGIIEGQKTWYDYVGKTNSQREGSQVVPTLVARVLPDATTAFVRNQYNALGFVTTNITTYSSGGAVALRTNTFVYASNNIDRIMAYNAAGVLVSSNSFNTNHKVLVHYNVLNEQTTFAYNDNQQLASVLSPTGLLTTNIYDAPTHQLSTAIGVGYATNTFTYTNDLVQTHTDSRGLTTANTWDALNRLTSITYPDGSYVSNVYTKLDLTATRDRLANWTDFGYDNLQRLVATTNALSQVTLNNYCTCGALESTLDAAGNLTQFFYDNQGNLTNTEYADGFSTFKTYNLLRQVVAAGDSAGNNVANAYNNQGLLVSSANVLGVLVTNQYDVLDRLTNRTDANGVSVGMTYDNLNRLLTRSYPDGGVASSGYTPNVAGSTSHTNQDDDVTLFAYDALGRKTNEVAVGVMTNGFSYNGAGDMLTLTDGRNKTTTWHYDEYGRATNRVDAAGVVNFVYQYDADGRLTNRWTPEKGNTGYTYDALGNRLSINYPSSTISYSYDALNRMTNMTDSLGTTRFSYNAVGQLLTAGGLWSGDTVTNTYSNRLRTALNVGSWSQTYGYDQGLRLTNVTSSAGSFRYSYDFQPASQLFTDICLPNGANIVNGYDSMARLHSTALNNYWGHTLDGYTYGVDALGLRTNIARNFGLTASTVSAGYDAIGQLTSWNAAETNGAARHNEQLGYAYDAAQNLKQRVNNDLTQTFTVDAANGLTNILRTATFTMSGATPAPATNLTVNGLAAERYGDFTFARTNLALADGSNTFTNIAQNVYGVTVTNTLTLNLPANITLQLDANGNLTNDGTRSFSYDAENQLTNVTVTGQWREDFLYDGLNRRRITRQYTWSGSAWTMTNEIRFVYDGNAVIQEWDSNNVAQVSYTRGINGLLARTDTSGSLYYHTDGNVNITALMDAQENIVARYLYDPFGRLLGKWGTKADSNVYRFAGKEWDYQAAFYNFGRRYYDPALQRFLNRDPINERGGLNLYAYCQNNPVCLLDLMGLCPWYDDLKKWALENAALSHNALDNDLPPWLATIFGTADDIGTGLLSLPSGIGHLGEATGATGYVGNEPLFQPIANLGTGTGTWWGDPTLANSAGVFQDISTAFGTAVAGLSALPSANGLGKVSSVYDTSGGLKGIKTDVTANEFSANLKANGYTARTYPNGTTVLNNGKGSEYSIYTRTSTGQSGAEYKGPNGQFLKYNLGQ